MLAGGSTVEGVPRTGALVAGALVVGSLLGGAELDAGFFVGEGGSGPGGGAEEGGADDGGRGDGGDERFLATAFERDRHRIRSFRQGARSGDEAVTRRELGHPCPRSAAMLPA